MPENSEQLLEIYTLGGLNITRAKEPITGLASSKAEALLAYLATTRRTCSREALAELLWENRPQKRSMSNLRVVLTSIREHLSPYVEITRQTVAINQESACWLDAAELEKHVAEAQNTLHQTGKLSHASAARLKQALELYQGSFLDSFFIRDSIGFEDWMRTERQRLSRMMTEALDELVRFYTEIGEYSTSLELGHRLLELDPLREETYRKLMLLSAYRGERIVALEYYTTCQNVLDKELGIQPEQSTIDIFQQITAGKIGAVKPSFSTGHLQAETTSLVGREKEFFEITKLLQNPACRLLTVTGPGGIGKTRLAQEITEKISGFPDGVYFVSLASVRSPDALISAIASGIQFTFQGADNASTQLLDYVKQKRMLLVLDNFEHLVDDATGLLMQILARSKTMKILVTSREWLNLQDEWLRKLDPLSIPPSADAEDAEAYSAVQLFLQHANRVRSDFSTSEKNKHFIARICQQVGGNPLGIELAAAWTRMLSCEEIAKEIQQNLDFLASTHRDATERHQSVKAVFEHSWTLLSHEERTVFKKLSVFSGGFKRDAADIIASASSPVLSALVDKSLIRSNLRGRYEMHELLHQYTAEKLAQSPDEIASTRKLHAQYYADFLKKKESTLVGRDQEAISQIKEEISNIRAAWQWAIEQSSEFELGQMLKSLWFFYRPQNQYEEALTMFSHAVERLRVGHSGEKESLVLGQALGCKGWFLYRTGLVNKGKELLQESVQIARQHTAWPELSFSLTLLGLVSNAQGEYDQVKELCQESLAIAEEINDTWGQAVALNVLGNVARKLGEYEEARELCRESLTISRATGDRLSMSISLNDLGQLTLRLGEYKKARQLCQESLEISTALGDQLGIAISSNRLGNIAQALGQYDTAQNLYQDSLDRSRAIGDRLGVAISLNHLSSVVCLQGDLDAARTFCEEALAISREINNRRGIVFSLNHLGQVVYLQKSYAKARSLYQESLTLAQQTGNLGGMATAFNGLGDVARMQEDIQESKAYLFDALKAAHELNVVSQVLDTLFRVSHILDSDGNPIWASKLVEFIYRHPAAWQETRDNANHFQAKLVAQLPSDVVQTARQAGQSVQLDEVLDELLYSFEKDSTTRTLLRR
ncbi:MAG: tetratricopeptide repeat protein [Chloroflexi bacterium]|nr:tetratricopeptide repeat protein [Chloroflexota bacterium]